MLTAQRWILGAEIREVEPSQQTDAQEISFLRVTEMAGLVGASSGGNQHGVGVSFSDLTGDGWPDIFVANGQENRGTTGYRPRFFVNNGDGTFRDATATSGFDVLRTADLYSASTGDYDNDGDIDLYLGANPIDFLFENDGLGQFVDVTLARGAGGPAADSDLFSDGRSKDRNLW